MALPCGCEPCYEGGYGDDGTRGEYSMEWCELHKAAQQTRGTLCVLWTVMEHTLTIADGLEYEDLLGLCERAGLLKPGDPWFVPTDFALSLRPEGRGEPIGGNPLTPLIRGGH